MKKLLLSILLVGSLFVAQAQDDDTPDMAKKSPTERAEKQTAKLTEKLSLTADQQPKIKDILLEKATKMDEIKKKYAGNMEAAKPEIKQLRMAIKEKLKAVLSAEQAQKFAEMRKENKGNRKAKM